MNTPTDFISLERIGKIRTQLDGDKHINCKLGDQGRLHIDRQLPHLCVHRRAADDSDTEKMLHGQAVYLTADAHTEIGELVRTIVNTQSKRFGSFLIVELWSGDRPIQNSSHPPSPGFHIHAPQETAFDGVLDRFENALQEITLHHRSADVKVSFDDRCAPAGLSPLLNKEDAAQRLAQISESFDLLLHVTPVNAARAWAEFERSRFRKTPVFHYRPRSADPPLLKRELYHIPMERIGDPVISDLFGAKREELDRQITLLNDRNSDAFLQGSMQLFGRVDEALLDTAKMLISLTAVASTGSDEKLSARQLAQHAQDEIEHYRKTDPSFAAKVEVREDITGILVSHGNFLIGSDAQVSKARLCATLNHEIGTHALTYHNGKKQPLQQLYAGLAGYEELQEGLAVLAEYLSDGLSLPRLQLLAGRVIAVHNICSGADLVECFHSLHGEYGFRPFTAFNMAMRVYRGGGYTKDLIYLRGFIQLLDYLANEEDMELLYCGKVSMEHLHLLQELRWRGVLKPLALAPRFLQGETSKQRLMALRAEPTIEHIIGNL